MMRGRSFCLTNGTLARMSATLAARLASGEPLVTRTLTDGGQRADDIAAEVAAFIAEAKASLELALYDVRIASPAADVVRAAIEGAAQRGVQVRLAYNEDHGNPIPVPPPPKTEPALLDTLRVPTCGIPGVPDLMHHKYVIRDGAAVWTGSTNWTDDAWTRQENVIVAVASAEVADAYRRDFDEIWRRRRVQGTGEDHPRRIDVGSAEVRAWFCPDGGPDLSHEIARSIASAKRRVRIASPVLTSAPILATLAQLIADGGLDIAGVLDATQVQDVNHQWSVDGHVTWKIGLLESVLASGGFAGKRSTPYAPGALHDYMHAKVTVADDVVFAGSFNLSHSGEENAENVLQITDPALADAMAAFIDGIRGRYPALMTSGAP
jgi:phosphatidylserine/phosphatidylglycerophosphate/cardiolipin synthase-like enzyme